MASKYYVTVAFMGPLLALFFTASASAQSLTWGNTSNIAITPQMVVGDYWTLNINGAAHNAAVVLQYTENGGPVSYYTLGLTDGDGKYYESEPETNASAGVWTADWFVGGVQLGGHYEFEVDFEPEKLAISGAQGSGCWDHFSGYDYGIWGRVDYTVTDSIGYLVVSKNIVFFPYFAINSGPSYQVSSALGGIDQATATFSYAPFYYCWTQSFSLSPWYTEQLWMRVGGSNIYDQVRSQVWYAYSPYMLSGEIWNNPYDVDIQVGF